MLGFARGMTYPVVLLSRGLNSRKNASDWLA
jgi:hypothetical protein